MICDAAYSLNATVALESAHVSLRARSIPRVNIHFFCEDQDTAAVIEHAAGDRRLAKAHVSVQMGGVEAAVGCDGRATTGCPAARQSREGSDEPSAPASSPAASRQQEAISASVLSSAWPAACRWP